jgi:hypothetical protein
MLTPEIMRARAANRPLLPFLLVSLLIAGCGFAAPWRFDPHKAIPFFLWMQAAWGLLFVVSIFIIHRRALWLLIGLPFVLYWMPAVLFFGCAWGPYACV